MIQPEDLLLGRCASAPWHATIGTGVMEGLQVPLGKMMVALFNAAGASNCRVL
jgi:hypothetical protein